MLRLRRGLAIVLTLILAVGVGGPLAVASPAVPSSQGNGMVLTKTVVDAKPLHPGEFVTYKLTVGCSSITDPCVGAKLVDLLPPPLVLESFDLQGFAQPVGRGDALDKSQLQLTFNEFSADRPNDKGLIAGSDYEITIVAKLPTDTSAELGGTKLVNEATLTSNLGELKATAPEVPLVIDPAPNAAITKSWERDTVLAGSGSGNTVTLGGIRNTSKVGATSLTILEPSGGSTPFASVAFTGFGAVSFPGKADRIQVNYFVGNTKHDGAPAAVPSLPAGVDPSTVTGFEFVFTSSESTTVKGGIAANGAAGSIKLNTVLRANAAPGTVRNDVSITAQTPKGDSTKPTAATDSFVVEAVDYRVQASKSFTPGQVVAGVAPFEGRTAEKSVVKLGASNASNQPLKTMTLTEPATGVAPFGSGIDFAAFVQSPWPANTDSIEVTIAGETYTLLNTNGKISYPADVPAGPAVTNFSATFTGSYAPAAAVALEFGVVGTTVGAHANTVRASGTSPGGTAATTDDETATLQVVAPVERLSSSKSFSPDRVEGIVGDTTTASLTTGLDAATNADVRQIVQTDMFAPMAPAWKPVSLTIANRQNATTVRVEYQNGAGAWVVAAANAGATAIALPADAKGVRISYLRTDGTFPRNQSVTANVEFELTQLVADKVQFTNVLGSNNGPDASGTVVVDKPLHLSTSKTWATASIVQKPSNMTPASVLKLATQNTSTYAVDALKISEPTAGSKPFDYMEITNFSAALGGGAVVEMARLTLTMADGATRELSGVQATSPATVADIDWANVVGFDFSLVKTGSASVPRDARFDLTVATKLRTTLLGTQTPIDTALAAVVPNVVTPKYTIKNSVGSEIGRGPDTQSGEASANLSVVTRNSVAIAPTLSKSFSSAGPATLFPANGKPAPVDVTLVLSSGADKADKIVVEDIDPTFWNAFNFVSWRDFQSGPQSAKMSYEFFTGASYKNVDGQLVVTGGEWVRADNLASTMAALVGAHNGKAPMTSIEGFRITITAADFAELARTDNTFKFQVLPRYELRSGELNSTKGDAANAGEAKNSTVANTASGTVSRLGREYPKLDSTAEYKYLPGVPGAAVAKTNDALNGRVSAGQSINYTMKVTNSGSEPITTPSIVDALPKDAKGPLLGVEPDFAATVVYTLAGKYAGAKPGSTMPESAKDVSATVANGNEVSFTFPEGAILYPGESYTIVLPVQVRAGVPAGTDLTNTLTFTGENLTAPFVGTSVVGVIEGQGYSSMKLVREVPTTGQSAPTGVHNNINGSSCHDFGGGFYRYPCVVETKPGGTAQWKLQVTNTGNVPTNHLEVLDIFPWVGDHGVTPTQAGTARGSQWTPTLLDIEAPALAPGTTRALFYLIGDPASCKPNGNLAAGTPWTGCTNNWVSARPANPKDIKGLKAVYDFAPGLAPNESVSLTFTTASATEMPAGAEALAPAWNSFGYYARAQVNNVPDHRSQEPIKTGITFRPLEKEKVSLGDFVWVDGNANGVQDAGEKGIKDVVLGVVGPDGLAVTDVYGNPVLPTMTDSNGKYTFENLPPLKAGQSYTVTIDQQASAKPLELYMPTKTGAGDRGTDSATWTATSEGLTQDGDRDPSLDFGFVVIPPKVSVGDFVWVDSNRDGIQTAGEKGIEDVVLTLTGPDGKAVTDVFGRPVGPATTDENGGYTFENLPALTAGESYTVAIDKAASATPLAPYIPTITGAGDRGTDSATWTATSQGLTQDGDRDPSLDFGFVLPKVSVGDYVWVDSNRDGIQTAGEKGIEDVVLTLTGPDGKAVTDVFGRPVGPATTDENGGYTFVNLPVLKDGENYNVAIDKDGSQEALAAYIPTITGAGDRGTDSSSWTATSEGLTQDGDRDPSLDFGFVLPKVSVGDYVWADTSRDGIQTAGEKGIEGVVLTLTGPDGLPVTDVFGNPVGSATTDENGGYTFVNLPVLKDDESYTVAIDKAGSQEALAAYIPTITGAGDRGTDSSTWTASSEGLTRDGDRDPSLDFGFVLPRVSVGDYVWVDTDRDGIQSDGEKGLADVVLALLGPDGLAVTDVFGNPVGPLTTDEKGKYSFVNLPVLAAGEFYTVTIDQTASAKPLAPYIPTQLGAGVRGTDSSTWTTTTEGLLNDGDRDPSLDFGFVLPKVSVGDYVWVDSNRDGIASDGEKGIKDVILTITGPDGKPANDVFGNPVGTSTTDEDGKYTFVNLPVLPAGKSYTVTIDRDGSKEALAPYVPTITGAGERGTDSSTWTATTEGLLNDGDRDPSLDFGFVLPKVSVGDYVWVDSNRDGIASDGEKGIKDVILTITGPDGLAVTDVFGKTVAHVATDKDGKYTFVNLPVLPAGKSYTVTIDRDGSKDALAPYVPTITGAGDRGTDSSTWTATTEGLLNDGDRDPSLDFGFVLPKVSVGDYVWVDRNGNGRQDAGEPGIKDVVLTITGPDGKAVTDVFGKTVAQVATDKEGKYNFENLPVLTAGQSYTVAIDKEASAKALAPYLPTKAGQGDRLGDSATWTASSEGLLHDGERDPTLDFGFVVVPPASVTTMPPTGSGLSNTGFDGALLMAMGLVLTALGGGALALSARRRRTSTARH
ncbi:SdrD B-like domain-containing protein [Arthrobacter sp. HLT1-20]